MPRIERRSQSGQSFASLSFMSTKQNCKYKCRSKREPLCFSMQSIDLTAQTLAVVTRFENGFNALDVPALLADMAEHVVFEHVAPPTSSMGRFVGHGQVGAVFASLDQHFPNFDLQAVEIFASGEHATCRWQMTFDLPQTDSAGGTSAGPSKRGLVRGCDVLRVQHGKIVEKLMYISFQ